MPELSGADSFNPWALCLESGLITLVFLPILAAALTTVDHWTCPGAHRWKGNTGEPLCLQPLARARVDSYRADKSPSPSKLRFGGGSLISLGKIHLPKSVNTEILLQGPEMWALCFLCS